MLTDPTESIAYISFSAEINIRTAEQLLGAIFEQISQGATGIYLLFSTPGGGVDPGINLYNVLKSLPVPLTIHNVGNVDSVGNAIFLSGKHRFACSHATFMFHGIHWNFSEQSHFEEKQFKEVLDSLQASQRRITGIIGDETTLTREEIDGFFIQAQTIDAPFAREKGIINEITQAQVPNGVPLIQLVF